MKKERIVKEFIMKGTNNLVAKHARKFNKAVVMRDRTKYKRKPKHNARLV
jgi:hypothetical protein